MKSCQKFWWLLLPLLMACAPTRPKEAFEHYSRPVKPDYAQLSNWAAWPHTRDLADSTPAGLKDMQAVSQADVFFLHPTTLVRRRGNGRWNAEIDDEYINRKTDESSILYQATLFNGVGRVYAPRYRQAHLETFFTDDTASAQKALDLAYEDVAAAFEYFLENENRNRPIILAGHSQGAYHLMRLLSDYFDGNLPLLKRLVVAYAVGYPIPAQRLSTLQPCRTPEQTACVCSWRTYRKGHKPDFLDEEEEMIITNPLSWTTGPEYVGKDQNLGSVLDGLDQKPVPGMSGAQIHRGILWTDKPRFKGSFWFPFANYHRGDFNIFYMNVRTNAAQRLAAFWK